MRGSARGARATMRAASRSSCARRISRDANCSRLARELRKICTAHGAKLLINDRIDVALACDADGVHLPADSFTVRDARELLGKSKLIGCSTHSIAEVEAANRAGAGLRRVRAGLRSDFQKRVWSGHWNRCASRGMRGERHSGVCAGRHHGRAHRRVDDCEIAGVAAIGSVFAASSPGDATRALLQAISSITSIDETAAPHLGISGPPRCETLTSRLPVAVGNGRFGSRARSEPVEGGQLHRRCRK